MSTAIAITLTICGSIAVIALTALFADEVLPHIKDYKLQKEKIKADALVRVEEVKARNQLELEKLMSRDKSASGKSNHDYGYDMDEDLSNTGRSKEKLR